VSQVHLIIQLHLRHYLDDTTRIRFVGTLLARIAAAWFAPILETPPLLQNFNAFIAKFEAVFGDSDKARTSANKGHVWSPSTPQNSGSLLAMSTRENVP
jgi:hypothetical protein